MHRVVRTRENKKKNSEDSTTNAGGFARGLLRRRLLDGKIYHVSTCALGVPFPQNQLWQLIILIDILQDILMMIINGTLIRNVESMVIVYAKHIGHCLYKKNFKIKLLRKMHSLG